MKKDLLEVGFEPTPSYEDQNALPLSMRKVALESGALDRSAILTCYSMEYLLCLYRQSPVKDQLVKPQSR